MFTTLLSIVFAIIALLLILIVLIQRGRGGGLVGAFGAGGGGSAFGTKTGDVFTTVTVIFFVVFMTLAIWLNWRVQGTTPPVVGTSTTAPVAGKAPSGTVGKAAATMATAKKTPPATAATIPATTHP